MHKQESGTLLKSLLFIFFLIPLLTGCSSRTVIVNGLDEKEANEILVFLTSRGIAADKVAASEGAAGGVKKEVLWDIEVRNDQASEALSLLNQYGLPRKKGQNLLGIFKEGSGLVPSEMQEMVKYQSGLAEQIANTLRKIDGVLDAEVQISFPKEDPLNLLKKKQPITASVFIKHNGVLDDPNLHLESKIKRYVAASVTGLDYDNVTLVGTRARLSDYGPGAQGHLGVKEKPFVHIWSIVIAKESLGLFRTIFFTFILLILFLSLFLIWVGWKIYPLLERHGGFRSLFSLNPLPLEETVPKEEEEVEKEEGEEPPVEKEEKGPPDEVT
jgi:type III secretion protein J